MWNVSTECSRCHEAVTPKHRRVVGDDGVYHLTCYEAWYFGRFGKLPRLRLRLAGDRKNFEPAYATARSR